jgi:hypothetical protein
MDIEITTPNFSNGITNNMFRNLRFTLDDGEEFNIVLGIKHSRRVNSDFPKPFGNISDRLVYGAHIVIVFDFLCDEFYILKNRYDVDMISGSVGDVFKEVSGSLMRHGLSHFDITEVVINMINCVTEISSEPILVTYDYPFGVTLRDIKKGEIKSIPPFKHLYKHRFN